MTVGCGVQSSGPCFTSPLACHRCGTRVALIEKAPSNRLLVGHRWRRGTVHGSKIWKRRSSTARRAGAQVARRSNDWLGAVISEAIVHHYGRDELLRRLAHPFWFQSFGAVMGIDWHSSGITTSVIGAMKRALAPLAGELGIHVCGGRGKHSRQLPRS